MTLGSQVVSDNMLDSRQKVERLYEFLGALSDLRSKTVNNISNQMWTLYPSDIPDDPDYVTISYPDRVEDGVASIQPLLSISKPDLQQCPIPGDNIRDWLENGWDDPKKPAKHFAEKQVDTVINGETVSTNELFDEDSGRVESYREWLAVREPWAEEQKKRIKIRGIFSNLFEIYSDFKQDSESSELMVGNGFLHVRDTDIDHPILLQRVDITFDADANTINLMTNDSDPELYDDPFVGLAGIRQEALKDLLGEVQAVSYHPMDRNDTPLFLRRLVHLLTPHSEFSLDPTLEFEDSANTVRLYMKLVFFLRKKADGTKRALDRVTSDIKDGGDIPEHLISIVSGGVVEPLEESDHESVEKQLAAIGGEDPEILLSKMANREQLEIARRIGQYNAVTVQGPPGTGNNAVTVQGPPGTGKTHTIANLIGTFLAQGKTVLVTSQKTKALTVLKDKIEPGLQDMCVSVLGQANDDFEQSIDGIIDRLSNETANGMAHKASQLQEHRNEIIDELAKTRNNIFSLLSKEYESIVLEGESISPIEAARYVSDNADLLKDVIPGPITIGTSFPLTPVELKELFRTNTAINAAEETELDFDLPNPETIMQPSDFSSTLDIVQHGEAAINETAAAVNWIVDFDKEYTKLHIGRVDSSISVQLHDESQFTELQHFMDKHGSPEKWMVDVIVAGKQGGAKRQV